MSRYTPPDQSRDQHPLRRRPLSVRVGVWVLLVAVLALVFSNVLSVAL